MAIEPCLRLARSQIALSVIIAILTQQTNTGAREFKAVCRAVEIDHLRRRAF